MKRKTYNNVMKAIKIIQNKGYNFEEAKEIVMNIFEQYENSYYNIEFYLDKVLDKVTWVKESV